MIDPVRGQHHWPVHIEFPAPGHTNDGFNKLQYLPLALLQCLGLPVFVRLLSAADIALMLSGWQSAALAYIGGSVGTLIGADLLSLPKCQSCECDWRRDADPNRPGVLQ
jgi:hypothetical protein